MQGYAHVTVDIREIVWEHDVVYSIIVDIDFGSYGVNISTTLPVIFAREAKAKAISIRL